MEFLGAFGEVFARRRCVSCDELRRRDRLLWECLRAALPLESEHVAHHEHHFPN